MWFGYARTELLPTKVRDVVPRAIRDYAARCRFGAGEVFFEPVAAETMLRDMLIELDRDNPVATVLPQLRHIAKEWGTDLDRVFDAPPRADVLWQIMDSLEGSTGAQLIVPSRAHLANLGPAGRAIVAQLTRMRTVAVHYLDGTSAPIDPRPVERSSAVSGSDETVLVESSIGAITAMAQLDVAAELSRLGLPEIIEYVDAVYVALIDDSVTATPRNTAPDSAADTPHATIRLLRTTAGQLIAELEEPRVRTDSVTTALTGLCQDTRRFIDGPRTFTRCTLPADAHSSHITPRGRA